ncbi:MAG: phosphoribosylamine--glycine ligase [Candidatus Thermoplasmatota archaeon]|nr:phosphoribosylamine--glycine ligase [Candidatus Thermoplasmatota archaeon]
MKVLTVGGGAREHTIVRKLHFDGADIYAVMSNENPGIAKIAEDYLLKSGREIDEVAEWAEEKDVDIGVIGPEAPLGDGIVDVLEERGIKCASPKKAAAEIETSKEFMRDLQTKYDLPGKVEYRPFEQIEEVEDFLAHYEGELAVKPVGLTGGKGVKVMGDHLENKKEVITYCEKVLEEEIGGKSRLLLEEKLQGEEYTLQVFTDGEEMIPMPLVQDHKRLFEGDKGPNTGGMGSYSQADELLPFVDQSLYDESVKIMRETLKALKAEDIPYKGILYGQFMLTAEGPKVVEFNCRWGDPEVMNVLPLLETNYVELCEKMAEGDISGIDILFEEKASVCKYVVPEGYGIDPEGGNLITLNEKAIEEEGAQLYYASVEERGGDIYTTTSRSLAIVGFSKKLEEAELVSERALRHVKGDKIHMRHDIGKPESIKRKSDNIKDIRGDMT